MTNQTALKKEYLKVHCAYIIGRNKFRFAYLDKPYSDSSDANIFP